MRIERVDDKTVKCFLSNEELEEYDIDYKDFVMRSDKAKEVVQEIIVQAEEELGYKPPKFAFDLQIMVLPDQGLLLTFSEKDSDPRENDPLIECLKEMKRVLQKAREKVGMTEPETPNSERQAAAEADKRAENDSAGGGASGKQQETRPYVAIFAFGSLRNLMEFASVLPANLRVESSLYGMYGLWYLCLEKGHAAYERYSRACVQAMEFGGLFTADEKQILQIREHAECLIAEKALKKLRG